ncbi:hypothetical protein SK128_006440 [Halocaridina rubra]|uniref:Uncharacterized protein n=1 Tax=Halocaridina rubra TaxID=373956 RepID=A0AAN8WYT6_HALRR
MPRWQRLLDDGRHYFIFTLSQRREEASNSGPMVMKTKSNQLSHNPTYFYPRFRTTEFCAPEWPELPLQWHIVIVKLLDLLFQFLDFLPRGFTCLPVAVCIPPLARFDPTVVNFVPSIKRFAILLESIPSLAGFGFSVAGFDPPVGEFALQWLYLLFQCLDPLPHCLNFLPPYGCYLFICRELSNG